MRNIRHRAYGTQAYFRKDGQFHSRFFAASEIPDEKAREIVAKDWLRNARAYAQLEQPIPDSKGPRFEADVDAYLDAVTSMPSFDHRAVDMRRWATVFKGRDRQTIKPLEIRTQLERWRKTYSASTCNKRRTALMSFYTRLNGRSGYNPVRDVEKYAEEEEPRAQHPYTIYRILAMMQPSKTRARLRVMLCTGWPHTQIRQLKPEHLDLKRGRAYVTPRRKGKGRKGGWLPLLPSAVEALKEFVAEDAFGSFSPPSMRSRFLHAQKKLNAHRARLNLPPLPDIRPYDVRHTFATWLAHRLTDDRALQELLLHSTAKQSRRYTEAATAGRVDRALATLATSGGYQTGISVDSRGEGEAKHRAKS